MPVVNTPGRLVLFAALLLISDLAVAGSHSFEVEARDPGAGTVEHLGGVNAGPWTPPERVDLLDSYVFLGVPMVRTHDFYGPTDLGYVDGQGIFPDLSRDPEDPTAYHFAPADEIVQEIRDAGAEVFFRIGYSWEDPPVHNQPPENPAKWAEIAAHVVAHYNTGWNGGHEWNIRFWEIWNEPDIEQFWTGTPQQFYDLYERTARRIRQIDSTVLVGGPGVSNPYDPDYRDGLLRYCKERGVPLDFFSWHRYEDHSAGTPGAYRRMGQDTRLALDAEGLPATIQAQTEWNLAPLWSIYRCTLPGAAFDTLVLAGLGDAGVPLAFHYRGDDQGTLCQNLGMHYPDGSRKIPAYSIQGWERLAASPHRRRATGSDWDHDAVFAGRSEDGRTLRVLLSNYDESLTDEFRLTVRSLGACGVERGVTREVLASNGFETVETLSSAEDPLVLQRPGSNPSVTLITIEHLAPWPAHLTSGTESCPAQGPALTWDAVEGATAYRVFRSEVSCDEARTSATPAAEVSAPSWTDPDGTLGAMRYYAVEPAGAYGSCDGDRRCISAACPAEPPGPVLDLRLERSGADILLSWQEAERAGSYRVHRTTHPDPITWGAAWKEGITDEDPGRAGVQWTDDAAAGTDPRIWFYSVTAERTGP